MCGIAGIIDFSGKGNRTETVESMLSSISYRGPDESGIYHSLLATFGSVRLSIIDIAGGQQPLSDPSGRYWIAFNGEIFNYLELRADLEAKGFFFRTQSDTEVIVQLYAAYGKDCLNMMNGQFAIVIWDKLKEEAFFARDRVGIRPLFFNLQKNIFSFASEIKSLFEKKEILPELKPEALAQVYTFWTTLTPDTVFENIYELSPGHYMVFNRTGLKIFRWWELRFDNINNSISLDNASEQFNELFSNAVRIRLRADVEVAAYLSGGIDSSATVSYIKAIEPGILNTFSIGFKEKDFDESSYQGEAVRYFNTSHRSITCSSEEIAEFFPKVIWHSETPMTRTAPVPMLLLSKLVRDNDIKVVITGEGSDEILAGYNIFKEQKVRRFWASQPDSSIRPLLLAKLYPYLPQMKQANPMVLKMFFGYKLDDVGNPLYSHLLRWNNSNHIKKHFSSDLKNTLKDYSPIDKLLKKLPEGFNNWTALAKSQWLETTIFMSGYLLSSQGDRMALANSVEGRYPFLDYRVIEFCSSLPENFKLKFLNEKYLLKHLLKRKIPESILKRSKQAYRAPVTSVFLSVNPPEYIKYMTSKEITREAGVFDFDSIKNVLLRIEQSKQASEVDNMFLTALISTHLLHHQFIKKNNLLKGRLKNLKIYNDLTT